MNKLAKSTEGEQDRALLQEALQTVVRMRRHVHRTSLRVAGTGRSEGDIDNARRGRLPTGRQ